MLTAYKIDYSPIFSNGTPTMTTQPPTNSNELDDWDLDRISELTPKLEGLIWGIKMTLDGLGQPPFLSREKIHKYMDLFTRESQPIFVAMVDRFREEWTRVGGTIEGE